MRGTPSMSHLKSAQLENYTSSLTNRGLVSFWSEHAALRPPKCVLRELSQEHLGKPPKTSSQDRKTDTDRQTEGPKPAPKPRRAATQTNARANTEPQGTRTSTTQARTNTNTHTHTETKRTRPGTVKGREPKKNNVNKGETADSRSRRRLAESCMPRSVADRIGRHVPSRTESSQPRVVADDLGLLTRSGWSRCAAAATGGFFRRWQTCKVQQEPSEEDEDETVADESSPSRKPSRAQSRQTPSYSDFLGTTRPAEV